MTKIWDRPKNAKPIKVTSNKYGQPIRKNHSKFNEYFGTVARNPKYATIDYKEWRQILDVMKTRCSM